MGNDGKEPPEDRNSVTYRTGRIVGTEFKEKVKLLLVLLGIILAVSTALLNILLRVSFNPAEIVIDGIIFLFFSSIILINYSPSRTSRSLGFKRVTYSILLFVVLILPPYTVQYAFYLAGYSYVFDFQYFALTFGSVMIVNFFITASWRWNRKFVDFKTIGQVKIRIRKEGDTEFERGSSLSDSQEELVREYIWGKIDSGELIHILGDTTDSRRILRYADSVMNRLKEKYRW